MGTSCPRLHVLTSLIILSYNKSRASHMICFLPLVPGNGYRLLHAQYVLRPVYLLEIVRVFTRNRELGLYCNRLFAAACTEIMLPLISILIDALPFAVQLAGAVQTAALFRTPGYGGHLHTAFGQCSAHTCIYTIFIIRPNDCTPWVIGVGWL